ncbi:MAG: ParB/RepB/Spo0J family partition protein, partial [Bacteroidota bacterium]|nr:ParB/RepB/Spo0J family partition protein [Bacteroidota bacterium]
IQPITVRIIKKGKFKRISGERRLRAAKMAGLTKIPAYVRKANDQEIIEFALVENIQRKDLNPIEISITFQRLMEECELTQERLSERTGKGRSSIANYLRLLKLPPEIQAGLRSNKISMGHAKVLSSLPDRHNILKIFYKILSGGLSVKKTQSEVDAILYPDDKPKTKTQALPDNYVSIKKKIEEKLGTKVDIKLSNKEKGKLIINFDDKDSFDTIIKSLS